MSFLYSYMVLVCWLRREFPNIEMSAKTTKHLLFFVLICDILDIEREKP